MHEVINFYRRAQGLGLGRAVIKMAQSIELNTEEDLAGLDLEKIQQLVVEAEERGIISMREGSVQLSGVKRALDVMSMQCGAEPHKFNASYTDLYIQVEDVEIFVTLKTHTDDCAVCSAQKVITSLFGGVALCEDCTYSILKRIETGEVLTRPLVGRKGEK